MMAGARGSGGHTRGGKAKKGAEASLQDRITDTAPPEGLSDAARGYWTYYAELLVDRGMLTKSGRDVLVNYCQALELRDRLQADVLTLPSAFLVPMVDSSGKESEAIKVNPLIAQLRQVRLECRQHANDLCLSPAAAMRMPTRVKDAEEDPLEQWAASGRKIRAVK